MDDADPGLEGCPEPVCDPVRGQIRTVMNEVSAFGGTLQLSFSLMSQNRNRKSSGSDKVCGSSLFRHRPDARGALQQSPILQSDIDKVREMNYNGKRGLKSLWPFTQLNEQTPIGEIKVAAVFVFLLKVSRHRTAFSTAP
jgi:hypothetical protein